MTEFLPLVSHLDTGWYGGGGELCLALRLIMEGKELFYLLIPNCLQLRIVFMPKWHIL